MGRRNPDGAWRGSFNREDGTGQPGNHSAGQRPGEGRTSQRENFCTESRRSHQLSTDQHKRARKQPEARERTTQKEERGQSLELMQDQEQPMFLPARVENLVIHGALVFFPLSWGKN